MNVTAQDIFYLRYPNDHNELVSDGLAEGEVTIATVSIVS